MKSVTARLPLLITTLLIVLSPFVDIADFSNSPDDDLVVTGEMQLRGPNMVLQLADADGVVRELVMSPEDIGRFMATISPKPATPKPERANAEILDKAATMEWTSRIDGRDYFISATDKVVSVSTAGQTMHIAGDVSLRMSSMFNAQRGRNPEQGSEVFVDVANNAGWVSIGQGFRLSTIAAFLGAMVLLLAGLVAIYIISRLRRQKAHLVKMQQQTIKAREEERRLLAAELHDGPVQELQYLVRSVGKEGALHDRETEVHNVLDTVSGTLRKICNELRPPILTHFGLESAMRWFTDQFQRRYDELQVSLHLDCDGNKLEGDQELALFRIMQESLNNIRKHANATAVDVHLSIEDGWAELLIIDNGDGFDVPRNFSKLAIDGHLGLLGITQRAEAIGAGIEFQSEKGEGTTVRVVTQLRQAVSERNRLVSFMKA